MYSSIERYLSAFEAGSYTVQLVHADKKNYPPVRREYSPDQLTGSLKFLQHKNALGYNIYARPVGYQYVLVDDLRRGVLGDLAGFRPCLLMETSPGNFQAFLAFEQVPASREQALELCREVAAYFGADPGSAEPDHVGRLPGFTNRKEKHRKADGRFPFVLLHGAARRCTSFSPQGGHCAQINSDSGQMPLTRSGKDQDRSREDFNLVCMLIRQGRSDEFIRLRLEQVSMKATGRRDDYIGRTILNARRLLRMHP